MIDTVLLCMAWAVILSMPPRPSASALSLKHRPDRFACFYCKSWRHNQRFDVAWCNNGQREFPELCDRFDKRPGNHKNIIEKTTRCSGKMLMKTHHVEVR